MASTTPHNFPVWIWVVVTSNGRGRSYWDSYTEATAEARALKSHGEKVEIVEFVRRDKAPEYVETLAHLDKWKTE